MPFLRQLLMDLYFVLVQTRCATKQHTHHSSVVNAVLDTLEDKYPKDYYKGVVGPSRRLREGNPFRLGSEVFLLNYQRALIR